MGDHTGSFAPKDYTTPAAARSHIRKPHPGSAHEEKYTGVDHGLSHDDLNVSARVAAQFGVQFGVGRGTMAHNPGADIAGVQVGTKSFSTSLTAESADEVCELLSCPPLFLLSLPCTNRQSAKQLASGLGHRWYQRWENNGWRSVAVKTVSEADRDPLFKLTAARMVGLIPTILECSDWMKLTHAVPICFPALSSFFQVATSGRP